MWGKIPGQRARVPSRTKEPIDYAGEAGSVAVPAEPDRGSPGPEVVDRRKKRVSIFAHRWGGGARETARQCHAAERARGGVSK